MLLLMSNMEIPKLSKHIQLHMSMLKTLNQVALEQLHLSMIRALNQVAQQKLDLCSSNTT